MLYNIPNSYSTPKGCEKWSSQNAVEDVEWIVRAVIPLMVNSHDRSMLYHRLFCGHIIPFRLDLKTKNLVHYSSRRPYWSVLLIDHRQWIVRSFQATSDLLIIQREWITGKFSYPSLRKGRLGNIYIYINWLFRHYC